MLEECLTPQGRMLRRLIRLLRPSFFRPDLDAIQRLGETDSWLAFRAELEGFSQDNQMRGGWVRNVLKVRLSGKLLNELAEYLFGPEEEEARPLARAVPVTTSAPRRFEPALGGGLLSHRSGQA
ncbi:MAG: hypothetical protein M5U12_01570 [Verrucomicrobia bacterium]|nr:hypothetical protein [Verrucomicrobiota bacterium]